MRLGLLYNPRMLCERLAAESISRRRLARLNNTPADKLSLGHIDSLELLELVQRARIDVIYDIGANVGTWTLLAKSIIPSAQIQAFEPLVRHCKSFADNIAGVENVTLHQIAVGSENTSAVIHVTNFSDASSLLTPAAASESLFGVRDAEQLDVQVRRLDDYRAEQDLPQPDLMKLDVQGYELEALKGGTECLGSVKAVITEVSFIEYYERQCLFHEVVSYLAKFDLFVLALGVNTVLGSAVGQTDVLFMRRISGGSATSEGNV
jgi:FkbM family methyltransferase